MSGRGVSKITDLYARSERRPNSECWFWTGAMQDGAQPRIWTFDHDKGDKTVMSGPRAVWNIKHGAGLGKRLAYMHCCQSGCVNPAHVRMAESKAEIGAHHAARGTRKGTSVAQRSANIRKAWAATGITVTPPDVVRAIRAAPVKTTATALAAQFGIAIQTVSLIRRGESHRHLLEAA